MCWGNNIKVSVCPSSTVYEETNKTTIASTDAAVGDTTIDVSSASGLTVGDIVNFGESGGYEYRITNIASTT